MTLQIGMNVRIKPGAYTRVGETGVITVLFDGAAAVAFPDGESLGYEQDELEPTDAPELVEGASL